MACSTLIQTVIVEVLVSQFKSTPSARKLVGSLYRLYMKLVCKLLRPSFIDIQLLKRFECVQNIDHTNNTQKECV